MPDNHGLLSDEEKTKIVQWINSKAKNHVCPSCGSNSWALADHVLNFPVFAGGTIVIGGTNYPAVLLACNTCAFVRHYMLVPMGVLPPPIEAEVEKDGGADG